MLIKKKININEAHSVSNIVSCLTFEIGQRILYQMKQITTVSINTDGIYYKTSSFMFDTSNYLNGIKKLKVIFTIFMFKDMSEFNIKQGNVELECEADYDNEYVRISSYMVGTTLASDFYSTVQHELTHIYERDKGGGNKRENFYKTACKLAKSSKPIEKFIGAVVYRGFPHEQDAMAEQFYNLLIVNFNDKVESFDSVLCYSEYQNYINAFNSICDTQGYDEEILDALCDNFGWNWDNFKNYVIKRGNRLYRKIKHAYQAYVEDIQKEKGYKTMNEADYKVNLSEFYRYLGMKLDNNHKFYFKH